MCDASSFVLSQHRFGSLWSFVVSYAWQNLFSISIKSPIGIFIETTLNLYISLDRIGMIRILSLPIRESGISFYLCLFYIVLSIFCHFQYTRLSPLVSTLENVLKLLKKLKIELPSDPAVLFLSIYPKDLTSRY